MTIQRAQLFIYGRVQGVFFRQSTYEMANRYNVTGYVRNRFNGSVEAIFQGEQEDVLKLLEWCRSGPPHASVQGIDIVKNEIISEKIYQSFSIESTE